MEVMTSGLAMRPLQALQQASTMASWLSQTELAKAFARSYRQMFSVGFSSGA